MDSDIEAYKKEQIDKLTSSFNSSLKLLKNRLLYKINYINSLKIHNLLKIITINNHKNNYNNSLKKIKFNYISNLKKIKSLSKIPHNKYALLIGINYINTPNELFGCINDTNNIKKLLENKYKFKQFTVLTDHTKKKPTRSNLINSFKNLLVNCKSGDSLFFLYSGHGTCTTDFNKDEIDGQDELIVPIDATNSKTCILDDDLNKIVKEHLKPGVKLFAIFDSCFSGTVLDLKFNYVDPDNVTINPNVSETSGQIFMISGCKDNQTSTDAVINTGKTKINTGALTFHFIKTIQTLGTSITLKALIQNIRQLLKQKGFEQIPQLSSGQPVNIETTTLSF
jgi:hypothetical protein